MSFIDKDGNKVEVDYESVIIKLLNKAGKDPRLTPRILRNKAEERLQLEPGQLKNVRTKLKKIIVKWCKENLIDKDEKSSSTTKTTTTTSSSSSSSSSNISPEEKILKQLHRLAKAGGKLNVTSGLNDHTIKEKISIIQKKLRDEGFKFEDSPTDDDINAAKKVYELKDALKEIDTSVILTPGKKRGIEVKKEVAGHHSKIKVPKFADNDEEAEF